MTSSYQQVVARSCVEVIQTAMEQPSVVTVSTVMERSASNWQNLVSEFELVSFCLTRSLLCVEGLHNIQYSGRCF